jgi:hypothetical protein
MSNDLLKPRYKVIADYPGNAYKLGDIITFVEDGCSELIANYSAVNGDRTRLMVAKKEFDKYPHLFKKLEWWEDRSDEDMPEYYKHKDFGWVAESVGIYDTTICFRGRNDVIEWHVQNLLPATEAEYLEYIKKGGDYE